MNAKNTLIIAASSLASGLVIFGASKVASIVRSKRSKKEPVIEQPEIEPKEEEAE